MSSLVIPESILLQIYKHARATYPEECCGFIFGSAGQPAVDEVRRVPNRQNVLHAADPEAFPRTATTAYNMAPRDILALEKSLRSNRPVRVIYHSHCDVGAYFSPEDQLAATWEGAPIYPVDYLVVDATKEAIRGAKLFRFDEPTGGFVVAASFDPIDG